MRRPQGEGERERMLVHIFVDFKESERRNKCPEVGCRLCMAERRLEAKQRIIDRNKNQHKTPWKPRPTFHTMCGQKVCVHEVSRVLLEVTCNACLDKEQEKAKEGARKRDEESCALRILDRGKLK